MKKISILFCMLFVMFITNASFATDIVDIMPPSGRLVILGEAEVKDNTSYVESPTVMVQIFAQDNVSSGTGIKYYLGMEPLTAPVNADSSVWKSYYDGVTESISIKNMNETNTIYLVLKDENGNTSTAYKDASTEYTITYDANGGINAPAAAKAYYGMPFNVSTKRPSYEGKYFLGWSTSKNATNASFYQASVIPADMFTDTKKEITLYAVWADEITELPLLSNRVKVGDYVDYPVYYNNVGTNPSGEYKANLKGWRVLSIENDGTVNLVSAGIPLTYYHYDNAATSIKNLAINFLNIPFSISDNFTFRRNGFTQTITLEEVFNNEFTDIYDKNTVVSYTSSYDNGTVVTYSGEKKAGELKVRSITKEDLDKVYDSTGATITKNATYVNAKKFGDILAVPAIDIAGRYGRYWLASAYSSSYLWNGTLDRLREQQRRQRVWHPPRSFS